jgi:hypothetical protein
MPARRLPFERAGTERLVADTGSAMQHALAGSRESNVSKQVVRELMPAALSRAACATAFVLPLDGQRDRRRDPNALLRVDTGVERAIRTA